MYKIEWNSIFWCKKGNLILQPFTEFHWIFMKILYLDFPSCILNVYFPPIPINKYFFQILGGLCSVFRLFLLTIIYLYWRVYHMKGNEELQGSQIYVNTANTWFTDFSDIAVQSSPVQSRGERINHFWAVLSFPTSAKCSCLLWGWLIMF